MGTISHKAKYMLHGSTDTFERSLGDRQYKTELLLPVKTIVPNLSTGSCLAPVPQEGSGWLNPKIQEASRMRDCGSQKCGGHSRDWHVGHKGTR